MELFSRIQPDQKIKKYQITIPIYNAIFRPSSKNYFWHTFDFSNTEKNLEEITKKDNWTI